MSAPQTMPALLDDVTARFGDRPAVVTGDVTMTWNDVRTQAHAVARALVASGVGPGDRVSVWMPNRPQFVPTMLGIEIIGAAMVPINTRYRGEEARVILSRSGASALVVCNGFLDTDYLALLDEAVGRDGTGLPRLHTIVDIGTGAEHALTWDDFLARADQVTAAQLAELSGRVTPDTIADIMYTSGTTGVPKGVMSAHSQTIGVADVWATGASLTEDDRYAIVNPFFHTFGYKAGVVACMTAGTTIYPVETFDAEGLMQLIQDARITVIPGAPTIFTTLINHPRRTDFDLSSLRFSIAGAATVPERLFADMLEVLGFEQVAQAYGLTECVVATQSRPHEDPLHVAQTTGPAVPGLEIRVVDGEGKDVATGDDGEIWIRGPWVMRGYFEDPEATAAAIDADGWLHTGDVGRLDEHGCVKITDRIKDMFTVGGFNVYPAEVENALSAHPDVVESAVIGIDDERMGSVGRAY
ncbi:MAG TPA: AMP-binding protein, partial [Marmoricola sp.]